MKKWEWCSLPLECTEPLFRLRVWIGSREEWELVGMFAGRAYFKRPLPVEGKEDQ